MNTVSRRQFVSALGGGLAAISGCSAADEAAKVADEASGGVDEAAKVDGEVASGVGDEAARAGEDAGYVIRNVGRVSDEAIGGEGGNEKIIHRNPDDSGNLVYREIQPIFLAEGEAYAERFRSESGWRLEYTLGTSDSLTNDYVFTQEEYEQFKSKFVATGELDGGDAISFDAINNTNKKVINLPKAGTYAIVVALPDTKDPLRAESSLNTQLEYSIYTP